MRMINSRRISGTLENIFHQRHFLVQKHVQDDVGQKGFTNSRDMIISHSRKVREAFTQLAGPLDINFNINSILPF